MAQQKLLFIDRDGTLLIEPEDKQIDCIEKFSLVPDVIPALLRLKSAGFKFVMVSNQDGLGSQKYPQEKYDVIQKLLLDLLTSQGIYFETIRICPHFSDENCDCRKPKIGLVLDYLHSQKIDLRNSYVIGDRKSDIEFAGNLGIEGIEINSHATPSWHEIADYILLKPRKISLKRKTNETEINMSINLEDKSNGLIKTGIGFFDHLLEQLAKHGGFKLNIEVSGDLHIDDHHTVEDTALVLGEAINKALGDKYGIARYGFLLPMDESEVQVSLDLSGRPYLVFEGKFDRPMIGGLSTELIPHFFRSFAETLKAALHIKLQGENTHHKIEAIFKAVGRTLRQAILQVENSIPSTKGIL